jgi:hypothetical protein
MQVTRRQPNSETDLAALCRRRERVVSVIRALECYQRALVRPPTRMLASGAADRRLKWNPSE